MPRSRTAADLFGNERIKPKHFSLSEFEPAGGVEMLRHVHHRLIVSVDRFRQHECPIALTPSPLQAGFIRFDGSEDSQHFAVDRLSTAGDYFPESDGRRVFMLAATCGRFGGVGLYTDTNGPDGKPQYMVHLDLRRAKTPTVWIRHAGKYYTQGNPETDAKFWELLAAADGTPS